MFRNDDRRWFRPRRFHIFSRSAGLLLSFLRRLGQVADRSAFLHSFALRFHVFDRADERKAGRLRQALGLRQCLVSWEPQRDKLWKARLSGPGLTFTIERTASGRCRAILRADRAMNRILASRDDFKSERSPGDVHLD